MTIQKYDIFHIDLNPKKWSTQAGVRPCVVVQNNLFNQYGTTIIVVPLTTNKKKIFPSEFLISPSSYNWLVEESRFLGSQIMTIDKQFFWKKIGSLESQYYEEVQQAIDVSLDRNDEY
jgi:mRNA interferase MazF